MLLVFMLIIGMFGCGSDEDEPEKPTVDPTTTEETPLSTEELLGSWDITSINDQDSRCFS